MMETILLKNTDEDLLTAAELIKSGEIVGMPTETVYGLAADATNKDAVKKVFEAKGRPGDNPLIVHLERKEDLPLIAEDIPVSAYRLAEKFWPGPLTMVLNKRSCIPDITTGGLDTVAIRVPDNEAARKLIGFAGVPIAAPSANRSGYPSPTTAQHVMDDMNGRISAVIDGGACRVGLESTVICFEGYDSVRILRPGFITAEDLRTVVDDVIIDKNASADEPLGSEDAAPISPGMKYTHYSPKAEVILIRADINSFQEYISDKYTENTYSLIFDYDKENFKYRYMTYGDDYTEQANQLFTKLRELDALGADKIFVRAPRKEGIGLAVYNRLIRASGFEVIEL